MKSPAPEYGAEPLGDMDPLAFRQAGHALVSAGLIGPGQFTEGQPSRNILERAEWRTL